jgi:hypothetical protein
MVDERAQITLIFANINKPAMSEAMSTATIIQFPGGHAHARPEPTPAEVETALASALAEAMRDYRNTYGIENARIAVFAQMYVLGIVETPALTLQALGIAEGREVINDD